MDSRFQSPEPKVTVFFIVDSRWPYLKRSVRCFILIVALKVEGILAFMTFDHWDRYLRFMAFSFSFFFNFKHLGTLHVNPISEILAINCTL